MKKFFQNRTVAIVITAVVVAACLVYGWTQRKATVPTPTEGDWVYDSAQLLSSNTEFRIDQFNRQWDTDYGSVMAIATVAHTRGWEMEDYADKLAENWRLGDNDSLLLIDKAENAYWMSPGAKTERDVGELKLRELFQENFEIPFYEENYDEAVTGVYAAMDECLDQTFGSDGVSGLTTNLLNPVAAVTSTPVNFVGIIIVLVVLFLIISAIDRSRYRRWAAGGRSGLSGAAFIPLLFWHRPGGSWFRSMEQRYRTPAPGARSGGTANRNPGGSYRGTSPGYRSTSGTYRSPGAAYRPSGTAYRGSGGTGPSRGGFGGTGASRGGFGSSGGSRGGFGGRR